MSLGAHVHDICSHKRAQICIRDKGRKGLHIHVKTTKIEITSSPLTGNRSTLKDGILEKEKIIVSVSGGWNKTGCYRNKKLQSQNRF